MFNLAALNAYRGAVDDAAEMAERVRRTLGSSYHVDGRDVTVPVSIGVCYAEDPNVGGHELMRAADPLTSLRAFLDRKTPTWEHR